MKDIQKTHLQQLRGPCIEIFSDVYREKVIVEIKRYSQRISGIMLKSGIPLYFIPWSEHYRKCEAYVEDLRQSINSLQHLSNKPSFTCLDIIKQARIKYDNWCLICNQLETTDMETVQKEDLVKMNVNAKNMQAEHRDYSSLLSLDMGGNILNNEQYKLHASNSASIFTTEVWSNMKNILDHKSTVLKTTQDTFYSMLRENPSVAAEIVYNSIKIAKTFVSTDVKRIPLKRVEDLKPLSNTSKDIRALRPAQIDDDDEGDDDYGDIDNYIDNDDDDNDDDDDDNDVALIDQSG